jgi:serine/threonine protein kinase
MLLESPPMEGQIVDGKYRLLRLLGEGGMGSVYEAEAIEPAAGMEPRVALKLLHPELLERGDSRARCHREARAASAIDVEHTVRVLDFGTDASRDAPYMVLYHALSGHPPHPEAVDLGEMLLAIVTEPVRLSPGLVPPEVASVVHKALEIDPARRFSSATAMLDAIRPLLPGGCSLDEGMLAPPSGGSGLQGAVLAARVAEPVEALAETKPVAPGER